MKRLSQSLHLFRILPVAVGVLCFGVFAWWLHSGARDAAKEHERLPLTHKRGATAERESAAKNEGTLIPGRAKPSSLPGDWPQFRGPNRDNVAHSSRPLAVPWPKEGPRVLWRIPVGEGHAGAVIHQGRVYLVDYDRRKWEDAIRCLSLDDGKEIWRYTYSVEVKRNHGMSRCIPAVNDRFLVAMGPMCHVHCLDAASGSLIWKMDLARDYGTTVPPWYAGQCPLIDGESAILAPGGKPLMMAVDLATSGVLWRTPPQYDDMGMTHSSIMPIEFAGQRQYVYCTGQGVVSVSARDGSVFWTKPEWKIGIANIPSPVPVGDGRLFFCGGYGKGSLMLRMIADGSAIRVENVFSHKANEFGSDQQTPILYGGNIYGVQPKPAELTCMGLDGKRRWTSGGDRRFGLGPYLVVDDMLLALDDQNGTLHLAKAEPSGYNEVCQAKLLNGHDAWAPMAFAEGRLILRDLTEMICVELVGQ
jgi:outer membrane protein assembly factor BamB